MGSALARQQALQTRGASSNSGLLLGTAPPLDAGQPQPDGAAAIVLEVAADDRVPVVFTWTHGGQNVFLAASFNGWREQIPMVRSGNDFSVVQELPRGVHQYKFIVDDLWRYAQDQPKTQDNQGNMNNVLDISGYNRFQVGMQDENEVIPKFGQHIPDPNDYTLDAPVIPMVLHKSSFCAMPPRPCSAGQPPSIPSHSLCDHVYLQEQPGEASATVAVTHRYGQKYSTTVFATRGPPCDAARRPNPLREAVRLRPARS